MNKEPVHTCVGCPHKPYHCDRASCFVETGCECVCQGCVAAKCEERGVVFD